MEANFLSYLRTVPSGSYCNLIAYAFYIAVTLLFYYLFKPVNRNLSLLAAFFSLLGCANDVLRFFNLAPYKISSLVFFGPYCLLIGYLIFRSTFPPRILGVLMAFAGLGWLIFLSPLTNHLSTYHKVLGFLAEASLMLWLIVKGVTFNDGRSRPAQRSTDGVPGLRPESCWNDCLARRKSIRLCVPSHIAYEVGAARQQTVRSPRTMDPHS
jgi:Domain of unknown function (DUF4386)